MISGNNRCMYWLEDSHLLRKMHASKCVAGPNKTSFIRPPTYKVAEGYYYSKRVRYYPLQVLQMLLLFHTLLCRV